MAALGVGEERPCSADVGANRALARSFIYRYLAQAFETPEARGWDWLCGGEAQSTLLAAVQEASADPALRDAAGRLVAAFTPAGFGAFADACVACFGHTVRGNCPMNEIEYGDIKADPLFQPHRLADLGAFYGAFGLEVAPDAGERIDHISIELEFLSVLSAKEAYVLNRNLGSDGLAVLRDAQRMFLHDHLARWTPAFSRRLGRAANGGPLGLLADLLRLFVSDECARFGVKPGSEDLLLRPADTVAERLCENCGLQTLPPGAADTGAKL